MEVVKATACATSSLLILSSQSDIRRWISNKTTGEASFTPFACMLLNAVVASYYGYFVNYPLVALVNGFNAFLALAMIAGFWYATERKRLVVQRTLFVLCFGTMLSYYTVFKAAHSSTASARTHLGVVLSCSSVALYMSPLAALRGVIRNQDTSVLSFGLAVMSLLCSSSWALYAFMLQDSAMLWPNSLGVILSLTQLSMFAIYPSHESRVSVDETLPRFTERKRRLRSYGLSSMPIAWAFGG